MSKIDFKIFLSSFLRKFFIILNFLIILTNFQQSEIYALSKISNLRSYYISFLAGGRHVQGLQNSSLDKLRNSGYEEKNFFHLNLGFGLGIKLNDSLDANLRAQTFELLYNNSSSLIDTLKDEFIYPKSLTSNITSSEAKQLISKDAYEVLANEKIATNELDIRYVPLSLGLNIKLLDYKMIHLNTGFNAGVAIYMGNINTNYDIKSLKKTLKKYGYKSSYFIKNPNNKTYSTFEKEIEKILISTEEVENIASRQELQMKMTPIYGCNLELEVNVTPGVQVKFFTELQNLGKFSPKVKSIQATNGILSLKDNGSAMIDVEDPRSVLSYNLGIELKITF